MASDELSDNEIEAWDENHDRNTHTELLQGPERDLIEYYFNRGLTYRHITLMLEKIIIL